MIDDPQDIRANIAAAAAGDREALCALWLRYAARLKRLVQLRMDHRVQGRVDPSDIIQDVYLEVSARLEEYSSSPGMPFYLWLRFLTGQRLQQIHRFHLGARMRDPRREVALNGASMPEASGISLAGCLMARFTSVIRAAQRSEMQLILQNAVNSMEPPDREILALRHFEELTNQEAALILEIDPSAASNRYVRALKRLRQSLQGKLDFSHGVTASDSAVRLPQAENALPQDPDPGENLN